MQKTEKKLPLDGIKVIDLSRLLPGPYCTMYMADLGATVIKVELPAEKEAIDGPLAAFYNPMRAYLDRNKESITLNLKSSQGQEVLYRLIKDADVLIEGFRPGVMDRLKIGYDTLKTINPKLVFCSISGYGQNIVDNKGGHDINYCSLAGVSKQIGNLEGEIALSNIQIADLLGGSMNALVGVMTALVEVQRTGEGRYIDISMHDGAFAAMAMPMVSFNQHGKEIPVGQDTLSGALPCYRYYKTKDDREFAVGALEPKFWEAFCTSLQRPDLIEGHRSGDQQRLAYITQEVEKIFKSKSFDEWCDIFKNVDACVTPVLTLDEVIAYKKAQKNDLVIQEQHPTYGELTHIGCPIRMSDFQFDLRKGAPTPGQDQIKIMESLGYSQDEIESLKEKEII